MQTKSFQMKNLTSYDSIWTQVYGDMQEHGPVHKHMRRILKTILTPLSYRTVIDVGCGFGHNIPCYADTLHPVKKIDGVDISTKAISYCRSHFQGTFRRMDIQTQTPSGTWDLVFCSLLLEHVEHDIRVIQNFKKMTGKYLVITTIGGDFERNKLHERQCGHVRNYKRGEVEQILNSNGFEVDTSIYWGFPFWSPLGKILLNFYKAKHIFTKGEHIISWLAYLLYFFNSWRLGDLIVIVAHVP